MLLFGFNLNAGSPKPPTLSPPEVARALNSTNTSFLGAGTFGESWRFDDGSGPRVAKILTDPNVVTDKRLQREVESLARGSSPHVVRLFEVRPLSLPIGRRIALVFEFVEGGDVLKKLQGGHWPTQEEVLAFAVGVLKGLAALHAHDVIHRDVKPENVALRVGGWSEPVLLDLGLGRILDASTITFYPQPVGTAPYMAPEIIQGQPARKGSDLWSLGVMLHLMLTRTHPFYPDPTERLAPDDAFDRLSSGAPALPQSVPAPLRLVVSRFLAAEAYERGSARRALNELEGKPRGA